MKIKFLTGGFDMLPVIRTKEELFSSTVINIYNSNKKIEPNLVITNANFYDLSNSGKIDAFNGHDPVPASATTALGYVVENKKISYWNILLLKIFIYCIIRRDNM